MQPDRIDPDALLHVGELATAIDHARNRVSADLRRIVDIVRGESVHVHERLTDAERDRLADLIGGMLHAQKALLAFLELASHVEPSPPLRPTTRRAIPVTKRKTRRSTR